MKELAADPRLIALFPAERDFTGRRYPNSAETNYASAGQLLGPVETVPGRFEKESVGVLMSRPGSRIRTKINGTFSAYTFSCWAKINSLKHEYNALFLSDGYENGEPHWQIRHAPHSGPRGHSAAKGFASPKLLPDAKGFAVWSDRRKRVWQK